MAKIEVTTRVTDINYNCNEYQTINTYFMKMLLKTILKMSYNTYTGVDKLLKEVSEQNVALVMRQRRFGAIFQFAT